MATKSENILTWTKILLLWLIPGYLLFDFVADMGLGKLSEWRRDQYDARCVPLFDLETGQGNADAEQKRLDALPRSIFARFDMLFQCGQLTEAEFAGLKIRHFEAERNANVIKIVQQSREEVAREVTESLTSAILTPPDLATSGAGVVWQQQIATPDLSCLPGNTNPFCTDGPQFPFPNAINPEPEVSLLGAVPDDLLQQQLSQWQATELDQIVNGFDAEAVLRSLDTFDPASLGAGLRN